MKTVIFTITLLSSIAASAVQKMTPEERDLLIQQKVGGFIEIEAKGTILVINCQRLVSLESIEDTISLARKNLQAKVDVVEGMFSVESAKDELTTRNGTAGIFIIDAPSLPISLVSLEESWGMVNVAKLREGASADILVKRTAKEFNRVLSAVFGGGLSSQKSSIIRPMTKASDLDKAINTWIPFDTLGVVFNALPEYGITHRKRIPYLKACQEGWAPAPTNEFQKAIWDKVHAMPSEPIKIKPETKKQEK